MTNRGYLRDRLDNPSGKPEISIDAEGCETDMGALLMLWIVSNIISHLAVQSVPTSTARPVTKSCPETGDCHENPFSPLPRDHTTALNQ